MPKGYNPQVIDSVYIPQQTDTIFTESYKQDSTAFQPSDTVYKAVTLIQDSIPQSTFVRVYIEDEIQEDVQNIEPESSFLEDNVWNFNRNFLTENPLSELQFFSKRDSLKFVTVQETPLYRVNIPVVRRTDQEDWLTGLGMMILLLFIWIRIFYGKFYTLLADSITNYQISAKLYLEKNVLTRRVSPIMDVIYFVVFAVFLYELTKYSGILTTNIKEIVLYGIILGLLMAYSLFRITILRMTGFLFHNVQVFTEYIHHTFIFNKGLGIVLFPVIIMLIFMPPQLIRYILATGIIIYLLAFILKAVRAYKIIIRKDVLLFYMILYLCSLEILPLLLGYKIMKSLILSY